MISPPVSPLPAGFSLSAPTNTPSAASSSFLFPPSPFTWAPMPDSPTPFNLMSTSPAMLTLSSFPPLLSPSIAMGSTSGGVGFNTTLPACVLPAAVEHVEAPPATGRSTSQPFYPNAHNGRPSATLASAITMAIPTSPHSAHPPHHTMLLSSFPPIATASASQPTPAMAPPTQSSHSSSVTHPVLTLLRSTFDTHTTITPPEQHRWQLLLTAHPPHHTRAQAEVGRLYEHFDAIVRRLSSVYERRLEEDSDGEPGMMGGVAGVAGGKVKEEALKAVQTIADKFVTSRQAVLHLHLYQSAAPPPPTTPTSKPPRSSSSRSSSSSSSSSSSGSSSNSPPPPSTRPIRNGKGKRLVNPPPPNSTSTKRSYFHKHSTAPLKQWLQANMTDPYPSSEVKSELSAISGLTYEQVQHWFINARMRVWRPMLRRQKEEQDRRQQRDQHHQHDQQQQVEGMVGSFSSSEQTSLKVEADGDSGSECETSVKDEESAARKAREWTVHSAELVPRLP